MLVLKDIKKDYLLSTQVVKALKGVDLNFRSCEFVAILGQSGCGKTTLLNIIGGLDRYTLGDLVIDGKSTKDFKDADWDAYRNRCIGYVFQSYNLIPHLSVLKNVELALTLSGINPKERKARAAKALKKVGLDDQLNKKPNQLSGGQMQRVAIARALVNEPQIILADEPTGALDSKTSVQIMEILKEVASDRLVIMVTHNNQLAETYANRTIRLLDGEIEGDTNPYNPEEAGAKPPALRAKSNKPKEKLKRTSMSFFTALNLSFKNLWTKRGRTFSVSLAGSIGIIGIALVLAISNGFKLYISKLETETLASYPITVSQTGIDLNSIQSAYSDSGQAQEFPQNTDSVGVYKGGTLSQMYKVNTLTREYVDYVESLKEKTSNSKNYNGEKLVLDVQKSYSVKLPLYTENSSGDVKNVWINSNNNSIWAQLGLSNSSSSFTEILNNPAYFESQYDEITGRYPKAYNEVALIVDSRNRISKNLADQLGLKVVGGKIDYSNILGKEYKIILNDSFYSVDDAGALSRLDYGNYEDIEDCYRTGEEGVDLITLSVAGVLRIKQNSASSLYSSGLVYTSALTEAFLNNCKASIAANLQAESLDNEDMRSQLIYRGLFSNNELSGMKNFFTDYGFDKFIDYISLIPAEVLTELIISEMEDKFGDTVSQLDENMQDDFWSVVPYLPLAVKQVLKSENQFGFAAWYMYYVVNNGFASLGVIKDSILARLGKSDLPASIKIFPNNFETKAEVIAHLDAWNNNNPQNAITYTDAAAMLSETMGNMVNIISYVLVAFAAVSLIVSSIMISIITYVSVIERTKEIGILRSIGARKIDVANVFNAETVIIGFVAGCFGVLVAYLLTIPINIIIKALASTAVLGSLAILNPLHAVMLIGISIGLTLISGLIPSFYASKKDPVVALRSE